MIPAGRMEANTKIVYVVRGPSGARFYIPGYVVADHGAEVAVQLRCKGKQTKAIAWAPLTARRAHIEQRDWPDQGVSHEKI